MLQKYAIKCVLFFNLNGIQCFFFKKKQQKSCLTPSAFTVLDNISTQAHICICIRIKTNTFFHCCVRMPSSLLSVHLLAVYITVISCLYCVEQCCIFCFFNIFFLNTIEPPHLFYTRKQKHTLL